MINIKKFKEKGSIVKNTNVLYTITYYVIAMTTHIIIMDCADDTEKKRVRYVIDKWEAERKGKGKVSEVKAIVVKADLDEDDVSDFLEELYSKISAGRVETYKAEIEQVEPEKRIESLKVVFKDNIIKRRKRGNNGGYSVRGDRRCVEIVERGFDRGFFLF